MALYDTLLADLKESMKAREERRTLVLRSLKSGVLEKEITNRTGGARSEITDELVIEVITKAAKQRRDSLDQYRNAGREDLAEIEEQELAIIETYLPKQLSKEEVEAIVDEVIAQTGAASVKDMGKVMGQLMPKVKGKADGKLVNTVVRERLGA
ncbi:MAG: GatB/YqeY domain-containing protein [Candidatus Cyclonatronum sp.]|uniref:GatB/YqeY domain-containing protein n=1 Tax=Cyclonatronum sp. TaxID=3024185 RepID=UPI0025C1FF5B|nr:GatB/YqeY domain-containing protein [Cyclonatronum sp.]MCC5932958.1 GatB/YqeY domain-containing protein [Balneolales bacterium]MCH8485325.1 GatB/YqeY domain-containing protein [Cyclonatronum sp.]